MAFDSDFQNVRLRLVNGSSIRGTIKTIDEDGNIVGSKILKNVGLGQVTSIDTGRSIESKNGNCSIRFKLGGQLNLDGLLLEQGSIRVRRNDQDKKIPVDSVSAVVWRDGAKVAESIRSPSSEYDFVIVSTSRGEQTVKGFLESITDSHVVVDYQGKSRKISIEKVMAVVMAELGGWEVTGAKANVALVDGSKLVGAVKTFQGSELNLEVSKNFSLSVDANEIATVTIQSDRIRYLSDIEPVRYEEQSQFAAARQWRRDTSLLGNPIRLKYNSNSRVLEFEKGIGTRSYTSIVFPNESKFDNLRGIVGIDMETSGNGDCEMVVEGDGIRLWSKRVRASDDPEPIVINIEGIQEVALIVLPGENFDLGDHADWADIRFTKSE